MTSLILFILEFKIFFIYGSLIFVRISEVSKWDFPGENLANYQIGKNSMNSSDVDVVIAFCFHSSLDLSELAKAAKKKLQSVSKAPA